MHFVAKQIVTHPSNARRSSTLTAMVYLVVVSSVAFALSFPGLAQNITGTIVGTVKDSSGAVMPGVKLSLTNTATNQDVTVQTDASGDFVAPNLSPGTYNLKTEASGFKLNLIEGVRLLANRT